MKKGDISKTLAEVLREKRKELKLTQVEVAEKVQSTVTTISSIETGKENVGLLTISRMINLYGLDVKIGGKTIKLKEK